MADPPADNRPVIFNFMDDAMGFKDEGLADRSIRDDRFLNSVLKVGQPEKNIRVNSSVLAMGSPFFHSYFTGDNQRAPINLADLEPAAVVGLVKYMYTGRLEICQDTVHPILKAAEKFGLDVAKNQCVEFMKGGVTPESCLRTRDFALKQNLLDLAESCTAFLINNFAAVSECNDFLELDYSSVHEIIVHCSTQQDGTDNEALLNGIIKWTEVPELDRKEHLPHLFKNVNLGKLFNTSPQALLDAFSNGILANNFECFKMYAKFLETRAVPSSISPELLKRQGSSPMSTGSSTITTANGIDQVEILDKRKNGRGRPPKRNITVKSNLIPAKKSTTNSMRNSVSASEVRDEVRPMVLNYPTSEEETDLEAERRSLKGKVLLYPHFRGKSKYFEEYNFETKRIRTCHRANLSSVRRLSTVVKFDGRTFDIGGTPELEGHIDGCESSKIVDVYNEGIESPTKKMELLESRKEFPVCILQNYLYVVGGCQKEEGQEDSASINCVERLQLDKRSSLFEQVDYMKSSRGTHDVVALQGKIFAIGGIGMDRGKNRRARVLSSVEIFDPTQASNNWEIVRKMNFARGNLKAAVIDDKIYVVGGRGGRGAFVEVQDREVLNTVEVFQPEYSNSNWKFCSPMKHKRSSGTLFEHKGLLFAIGGNSESHGDPSMEVYDPRTDRWELLTWPADLCSGLANEFNSGVASIAVD